MSLTDLRCRTAKPQAKPYRLYDTGALYLEVMPNGSRFWFYKYNYNGKEKRLAIGSYPEVSLSKARNEDITAKQPEEEPSKAQQVAAAFATNNNLEEQAEIERERRKQEMIAEQKAAELKRKLKRGQRYVIFLMVSFNLNFRSYTAKLDQFIANKDMITTAKPVAEVRPLDQFRLN